MKRTKSLLCTTAVFLLSCGDGSHSDPGTYTAVEGWPQLAPGVTTGQVAGLALGTDDTVWLFHRADHPWNGDPEPTDAIPSETLLQLTDNSGALVSALGQDQF